MQTIELTLPDPSIFKAYDVRGIVDRTLTQLGRCKLSVQHSARLHWKVLSSVLPSAAMADFQVRCCVTH